MFSVAKNQVSIDSSKLIHNNGLMETGPLDLGDSGLPEEETEKPITVTEEKVGYREDSLLNAESQRLEDLKNFEFTESSSDDAENFLRLVDREEYINEISGLPDTIFLVRLITLLQDLNDFYKSGELARIIDTELEDGQDLEEAASKNGIVKSKNGREWHYSDWYTRYVMYNLQPAEMARITDQLLSQLKSAEETNDHKDVGVVGAVEGGSEEPLEIKEKFSQELIGWVNERTQSFRQKLAQLLPEVDQVLELVSTFSNTVKISEIDSALYTKKVELLQYTTSRATECAEMIHNNDLAASKLQMSIPDTVGSWNLSHTSFTDLAYTQTRLSAYFFDLDNSISQAKANLAQMQERIKSEL